MFRSLAALGRGVEEFGRLGAAILRGLPHGHKGSMSGGRVGVWGI